MTLLSSRCYDLPSPQRLCPTMWVFDTSDIIAEELPKDAKGEVIL
jgi:hypothetical protein